MKHLTLRNADRLAVVMLLAMLVTNPLTGQYILQGLEWLFQQLFSLGAYVNLWGSFLVLVVAVLHYFKSERVTLPKGNTVTQKYIET